MQGPEARFSSCLDDACAAMKLVLAKIKVKLAILSPQFRRMRDMNPAYAGYQNPRRGHGFRRLPLVVFFVRFISSASSPASSPQRCL
ncbi:unnamed protein product [Prunus armeniaca]